MYNFIDVNETSEGVSLPSEAMKINGEFIENQIEGYRTLNVVGREALSPEVATYETGIRDGSTLRGKRYPARIIRITYQLVASSDEAFREAFNKLGKILDVTNAELIFNDESDKYFIGTPAMIGEVPPGRNSVVGEFEILCLDPFKYSVLEYEATAEAGETSILLDYNGTYKSFPKLQAEFFKEDEASEDGESVIQLSKKGDCGYVAFFNEKEKIVQLGDPEEADIEYSAYQMSQTLINNRFDVSGWSKAAQSQWKVNSGMTSSSAVVQTGVPILRPASYKKENVPKETTKTILTATSQADHPYIHYKIIGKVHDRTATSAKVTITLETRLDNKDSYFLNGFELWASFTHPSFSGYKQFGIKSSKEEWRGTSSHSKSFSFTVTGLNSNQTQVTNLKFGAFRKDTFGEAGTLDMQNCAELTVPPYYTDEPETYYLSATDFGSGSDWHGPSITRTIPVDEAGIAGAENFTLTYSQRMCIGDESNATNQLGAFQVLLVNGSGANRKIVAGVNVYKGGSGKTAKLRFYMNGGVEKTVDIDLSHNNKNFTSSQTSKIQKFGGTVVFIIGGKTYSFNDYTIGSTAVNEITFTFTQFGTKPKLAYNGLYWAKFVKNNCQTWRDIPNKFSANDVVEADCKTGEVYVNGVKSPTYGALGNDYEEFYLTPGLNQIGYSYSSWVEDGYAPTFKLKYREVFL